MPADYDNADDRRSTQLVLTTTVAPSAAILSLALAKDHLRIRHSHEDSDITALVEEGTQWLERHTGRSLRPASFRLDRSALPAGDDPIVLPRGPVSAIDSMTYIDGNGSSQTLTTTNITLGVPGRIAADPNNGWPAVSDNHLAAISITYTAGYAAGDCPGVLIRALKLWIDREYHEHEPPQAQLITQRIESICRSYQVRDPGLVGLQTA